MENFGNFVSINSNTLMVSKPSHEIACRKISEVMGITITNKRNSMYPYHNKIKQRIGNNELVSYEYVEKYKDISPCLLLRFETEPRIRPIREHRFKGYEELFKAKIKE